MSGLIKAQRVYEILLKSKPFEDKDMLQGSKLNECFKKYPYFAKAFNLKTYLHR